MELVVEHARNQKEYILRMWQFQRPLFHQLLDDGSRSLDDLAGSYLVGDGIGEKMYDVTHGFFGRQMNISCFDTGRMSSYQA